MLVNLYGVDQTELRRILRNFEGWSRAYLTSLGQPIFLSKRWPPAPAVTAIHPHISYCLNDLHSVDV